MGLKRHPSLHTILYFFKPLVPSCLLGKYRGGVELPALIGEKVPFFAVIYSDAKREVGDAFGRIFFLDHGDAAHKE